MRRVPIGIPKRKRFPSIPCACHDSPRLLELIALGSSLFCAEENASFVCFSCTGNQDARQAYYLVRSLADGQPMAKWCLIISPAFHICSMHSVPSSGCTLGFMLQGKLQQGRSRPASWRDRAAWSSVHMDRREPNATDDDVGSKRVRVDGFGECKLRFYTYGNVDRRHTTTNYSNNDDDRTRRYH